MLKSILQNIKWEWAISKHTISKIEPILILGPSQSQKWGDPRNQGIWTILMDEIIYLYNESHQS